MKQSHLPLTIHTAGPYTPMYVSLPILPHLQREREREREREIGVRKFFFSLLLILFFFLILIIVIRPAKGTQSRKIDFPKCVEIGRGDRKEH